MRIECPILSLPVQNQGRTNGSLKGQRLRPFLRATGQISKAWHVIYPLSENSNKSRDPTVSLLSCPEIVIGRGLVFVIWFPISAYVRFCLPSILLCYAVCLVAQSCPTLSDAVDCITPGSAVHGYSPGKGTGVCCHALLQGIFPVQGWNPGLPHCRWVLYCLSHQGSPFAISP